MYLALLTLKRKVWIWGMLWCPIRMLAYEGDTRLTTNRSSGLVGVRGISHPIQCQATGCTVAPKLF